MESEHYRFVIKQRVEPSHYLCTFTIKDPTYRLLPHPGAVYENVMDENGVLYTFTILRVDVHSIKEIYIKGECFLLAEPKR